MDDAMVDPQPEDIESAQIEQEAAAAPAPVPDEPQLPPLLDLSRPVQLSNSDKVTIRVLTLPEIERYVAPIFNLHGALLPRWTNSFFVGAVDWSGRVLGWITVQSVVHTEPMYVEEGKSALLPRLVAGAQAEIERVMGRCKVYLTAEDDRVVRLAEHMGMVREPGTPMTKWIGPEPVLPKQGEPS